MGEREREIEKIKKLNKIIGITYALTMNIMCVGLCVYVCMCKCISVCVCVLSFAASAFARYEQKISLTSIFCLFFFALHIIKS